MHKTIYLLLTLFLLSISFSSLKANETSLSSEILEKLNTIESRIKVLEKATFNKTTSQSQGNVSLDDYQSIIAKQSIQISDLQNELQSLTAQVEEIIFTMQSTVNNFNSFREDAEFRMEEISNLTETINENKEKLNIVNESAIQNDVNTELEPKSLGTIQVNNQDQIDNSPFELKVTSNEVEQEITNTISQDNLIVLEDQKKLEILPDDIEDVQYQFAMDLLKQGDYETAEIAFQEFLNVGENLSLLSNSNFWLAETLYVRENYKDAAKNYLNLYQVYPESMRAPDALLKLGISLIKMDQREQGCLTFLQLQDTYPNATASLINRSNLELQKNECEIS
tara:strand:- start:37 stop:1050 length:1014 start_codon:yes stop_codon:yes gene_type:complete